MQTKNLALFTLLTILTLPIHANEICLDIKDAWIAEAPPVSKVMVAYLTIMNKTSEKIEITGAESNRFSSIEFHETRHENGIAKMIRHRSLTIPANENLTLKRGGNHLMLFNPTNTLKANDNVTITFTYSDGSTQSFDILVKKANF